MAEAQSHVNPLVSDGITEELFLMIWSKDELNFSPSINVPDTVVYKYGQPVNWYFTSKGGRIKRKNRQNLVNARIEEAFLKHMLGYDVVATFISIPVETEHIDDDNHNSKKYVVQYLDKQSFADFLYKSDKEHSGILQRFIEPKGVKNECIRAVWSPKVCLLERAENIHQLHDHRYGLYERCVTYEGPEYYSVSQPLRGPVLAGQLQRLCESIVNHISEVTFSQQQVSRIVLNFKVDSRDKIWLLYSTSIRCNDMMALEPSKVERNLVNIESVISLPNTVNLNPQRFFDKIPPRTHIRCLSCGTESLSHLRHPVTYKSIVKHYEHVLHLVSEINGKGSKTVLNWPPDPDVIDAAGGVGFGCLQMVSNDDALSKVSKLDFSKPSDANDLRIPPIIRYIHPKLNAKSYERCRRDPLFLYKTVTVCESCYLIYAEFTTMLLRLGHDLTKLLSVDNNQSMIHTDASTSLTRPSSADWRAMSTVNRSVSAESLQYKSNNFSPGKNHKRAKENAIGIRTSDPRHQPPIPTAIRKSDDAEPIRTQYSVDSFGTNPVFKSSQAQISFQNSISQRQAPQNTNLGFQNNDAEERETMQSMIMERERHFFKEVAKNPQLRDQHPLMHLISAQQKIEMVDKQAGVLADKSSKKQEGVFGQKYGKTLDDKYDKYDPYKQDMPYRIDGKLMLPSTYLKMKKLQTLRRQQKIAEKAERRRRRNEELMNGTKEVMGAEGDEEDNFDEPDTVTSDSLGNESMKHADFLRDTLRKIESGIQNPAGFKIDTGEPIPVPKSKDIKGKNTAMQPVLKPVKAIPPPQEMAEKVISPNGFSRKAMSPSADMRKAMSPSGETRKGTANTQPTSSRPGTTSISTRPGTTSVGTRPGTTSVNTRPATREIQSPQASPTSINLKGANLIQGIDELPSVRSLDSKLLNEWGISADSARSNNTESTAAQSIRGGYNPMQHDDLPSVRSLDTNLMKEWGISARSNMSESDVSGNLKFDSTSHLDDQSQGSLSQFDMDAMDEAISLLESN